MYTDIIIFEDIEQVKKFSSLANKYKEKISLVTNGYKVDAKSIMGIFSLDLSKPMQVEVDCIKCPELLVKAINEYKAVLK